MADVMTNLQVEGVQSPLKFLLGDRYHSLNFELPDESWSLDNTDHIEALFDRGRITATQAFEALYDNFFDSTGPDYVAFDATGDKDRP